MRNSNYQPIVYNNGIYGIKSSLRHRIQEKTMECLNRRREYKRTRKYSKAELIIKLSLVISIVSLIAVIWIS
ncbi:MAG: hypothetical protein P1U56_15290 [Saprospiraceae bacterium]|nr:hypothetical protein [Saprospiraceae bacterium]